MAGKGTENPNFWQETPDPAHQEISTKKKKKSGGGIFTQAWQVVENDRKRIYPNQTNFLDFGDGFSIVEERDGSTFTSSSGENEGEPRTQLLEKEEPSNLEVPDNVRRLAFGITRGMGKSTSTQKAQLPQEITSMDSGIKGRHIEGTTITVYDGENHDQVFANPRVEEVNSSGLLRMAGIVRRVLGK